MKKTTLILASVAAVALAAPVFADDTVSAESKVKAKVERKDDGSYVKDKTVTEKSKDANGTVTKEETDVKVKADANGDAESTAKTTTVTDPKGLFNKTKTVTTDSVKKKHGKVTRKHKKKVNGKTVEDSSTPAAATTSTDTNATMENSASGTAAPAPAAPAPAAY